MRCRILRTKKSRRGKGKRRDHNEDHNEVHKKWYGWLRTTRHRNADGAERRSSTDGYSSRSMCGAMVERTAFPIFNGK